MVEQEDGEEFVLDIVHEIVESTLAVIYDKYIASQTLPYTIQATKDLLLQIIEVLKYNKGYGHQSHSGSRYEIMDFGVFLRHKIIIV